MLMTVAFLTAFYMFRVVFLAFFAPRPAAHPSRDSRTSPTEAHGAKAGDPP